MTAAPALAREAARPLRSPLPPPPSLSAVPQLAPRGRLGVAWALVTGAAMAGGPWVLAVWLGLGAVVAVAAVARTWSGRVRPSPAGALLAAAAAPIAAAAGAAPFAAVICAALALALLPRRHRLVGAVRAAVAGTVAAPAERAAVVGVELVAAGLCAGALVLTERTSVTAAACLLALVCCHDASRYLIGTGAPAPWEGTAAGMAAVGSAALALAVLQPSPVSGGYPWLLAVVVVLAGLTGRPASRLLTPVVDDSRRPSASRRGSGRLSAPGPWLRLDTLLLAAPAWLVVAGLAHF